MTESSVDKKQEEAAMASKEDDSVGSQPPKQRNIKVPSNTFAIFIAQY